MYTCITWETFVSTIFRRVFHLILKLKLCHACRRRDVDMEETCRYGRNMPTTALVHGPLDLQLDLVLGSEVSGYYTLTYFRQFVSLPN